jgi:ABC-type sugar transport system ATPase subunit
MVFQSYALYPHLNVRDNMGFGLKIRKVPADEAARRVREAATTLQIEALLDRFPRELSGGQRQRVAIGRAIVGNPEVFLFDEPLSNLDAELRVHMRSEIAALHKRLGNTMIYVTHDQIEAMTLADKIVVLRDGLIEQVGTPRELYSSPRNEFVAQFIGSPRMNLIPLEALPASLRAAWAVPAGAVRVGMRPEHLSVAPAGEGQLTGTVILSEFSGAGSLLHVAVEGAGTCLVLHPGPTSPAPDETVRLAIPPVNLQFFDRDGIAVDAGRERIARLSPGRSDPEGHGMASRRQRAADVLLSRSRVERHAVDGGIEVVRREHEAAAGALGDSDRVGHPIALEGPAGLDAAGP